MPMRSKALPPADEMTSCTYRLSSFPNGFSGRGCGHGLRNGANAHSMRTDGDANGYDIAAPKRPVNMTLNEDLIRRARGITSNLSETVETLLAAFVEDAEAKTAERERQVAANEALVENTARWPTSSAAFDARPT
jgi:antitoxin CcdA